MLGFLFVKMKLNYSRIPLVVNKENEDLIEKLRNIFDGDESVTFVVEERTTENNQHDLNGFTELREKLRPQSRKNGFWDEY